MDYRALQAEILTGPRAAECAPHIHTNDMARISGAEVAPKDAAIAAILSRDRTRIARCDIGIGAVLSLFGVERGAQILDALDALRATVPAIRWAWVLIDRDALDVGDAATRAQIDALTPGVFAPDEAAALKALAAQPDPLSAADVSRALRGPWD